MYIFDSPIVEEFDCEAYHGFIRRHCSDGADAETRFHPSYQKNHGRRRYWRHDNGYASVEECREFLQTVFARRIAEDIKARRRGAETRKRRKEEKIAKITRDFLLGKHIGNLRNCAFCEKVLSDPVSIERGLGSECWPHLMDRLSLEVPRCEQTIERLHRDIAELETQDIPAWLSPGAISPLEMRRRDLADAELLLVAARKWAEGQSNNQSASLLVGAR
jgi:hypothetical protein